jgi:hypothetical protein
MMNTQILKSRFLQLREQGISALVPFFNDLHQLEDSETAVVICLWILKHPGTSTLRFEVTQAASELARRRRPEVLPWLKVVRMTLPPISGTRDYRQSVDFAIDVLQAIKGGHCTCDVYARPVYNTSPRSHQDIRIFNRETANSVLICRCLRCGVVWHVKEQSGDHLPVYHWQKA